jgi:hypothetical protein
MGRAKEEMMHQQELEPFYEWLEDHYGDDAPEEDTAEWDLAYQEFCDEHERKAFEDMEDYYYSEYQWLLSSKSTYGNFLRETKNIGNLIKIETDNESYFSLLVMLHAHTVASLEAYLAATFIQKVTKTEALIKKAIETDKKLSERSLSFKEFYEEEKVKKIITGHFGKIVFHDMNKVRPLFKKVLGIDFGDIEWLIEAVEIRHHCVHRAGLNREGEPIDLTAETIAKLVSDSRKLVGKIESELLEVPELNSNM